jgi:hypothetical protein
MTQEWTVSDINRFRLYMAQHRARCGAHCYDGDVLADIVAKWEAEQSADLTA